MVDYPCRFYPIFGIICADKGKQEKGGETWDAEKATRARQTARTDADAPTTQAHLKSAATSGLRGGMSTPRKANAYANHR